jgi:hypothetical protein
MNVTIKLGLNEQPQSICRILTNRLREKTNYTTYNDLSLTIDRNICKIPRDIDLVVGVPLSGRRLHRCKFALAHIKGCFYVGSCNARKQHVLKQQQAHL